MVTQTKVSVQVVFPFGLREGVQTETKTGTVVSVWVLIAVPSFLLAQRGTQPELEPRFRFELGAFLKKA